ncbi:MAG: glycoside hydrolase family 3 N-terminal domain-containing protein, partial [bacterium]
MRDILRGRLGFGGAIVSDDLTMEGARRIDGRALGYSEAAALALTAGCDLVLLCNRSAVDGGRDIDQLLEGLTHEQARGRSRPDPDSKSRRLALLPQTPPWPGTSSG